MLTDTEREMAKELKQWWNAQAPDGDLDSVSKGAVLNKVFEIEAKHAEKV